MLINGDPLVYALEAVTGEIYGVDLYPTLEEKAAAVSHVIVTRHIFLDGNKRTALEVLFLILEMNGRTILASDDEFVELMERLAAGEIGRADLIEWVRARVAPTVF